MTTKTCPICETLNDGPATMPDLGAVPWRCGCAGFGFAVSRAVLNHDAWRYSSEEQRRAAVYRARRARRDTILPMVTMSDLDIPSVDAV